MILIYYCCQSMTHTTEQTSPSGKDYWFLLAAASITFFFCLTGLSPELTLAEIQTALSIRDSHDALADGLFSLYPSVARLSTDIFGVNPLGLRLPAVVFTLLSIPLVFLVTRYYSNNTTALLTAFLWAVTLPVIWFATYASGFALLNLLQLLLIALLLEYTRRSGCSGYIIYGILLAIIGMVSHVLAPLVIVAILFTFRNRLRDTMAGHCLEKLLPITGVAVIASLWLNANWSHLFTEYFAPLQAHTANAQSLLPGFTPRDAAKFLYYGARHGTLSYLWVLLPVAGALGLLGLIRQLRHRMWDPVALVLFYLALIASAEPTVTYAVLALPLLAISCSFVIGGAFELASLCRLIFSRFGPVIHNEFQLGRGFAAAVVLISGSVSVYATQTPKQDLQGALQQIRSLDSSAKRIVVTGPAARLLLGENPEKVLVAETPAELYQLEHEFGDLWVVQAFPAATKKHLAALNYRLHEHYDEIGSQPGTIKDGDFLIHRFSANSVRVDTHDLGGGLYVMHTSGGGGCNIGVLSGPEGALLIDTSGWKSTHAVRAALQAVDAWPPRWVINSHWHRDHSGGNAPLARQGAVVIAAANTQKWLTEKISLAEVPDEAAIPSRLIDSPTAMSFAGQDIEIIPVPAAHTDGDIIVHIRSRNVFHMGDLFVNGSFPYISAGSKGKIDGYLAAQRLILDRSDDRSIMIPGHGPIGTRADLLRSHNMLTTARNRVARLRAAGKTSREIMQINPLEDMRDEWGGSWIGPRQMAKFIYHTL